MKNSQYQQLSSLMAKRQSEPKHKCVEDILWIKVVYGEVVTETVIAIFSVVIRLKAKQKY